MLTTVLNLAADGSWVIEIAQDDVMLSIPLDQAEGVALTILSLVADAEA